jgi:hypothetical protein
VIAFAATNELDKGVINTQGVIRTADPTWTFAITGGTRKYKKAHGTVPRKVLTQSRISPSRSSRPASPLRS